MKYLLIVLLFPFFLSCSFDYEGARVAEDLSEEIPETILVNFTRMRINEGKPEYSVSGTEAAAYDKKMETVLKDVIFLEYREDGTVATEGRADTMRLFTETEDAEIEGDIRFYQSEEAALIQAEALSWENEGRVLKGTEGTVTVQRDSGSTITGQGFRADMRQKRIEFTGGASGTWVEEEEEEESEAGEEEHGEEAQE